MLFLKMLILVLSIFITYVMTSERSMLFSLAFFIVCAELACTNLMIAKIIILKQSFDTGDAEQINRGIFRISLLSKCYKPY